MNYSAMLLWSESYRKEQDDKLHKITNNFLRAINGNKRVETTELHNFIQEYPTYNYNRTFSFAATQLNVLQLAIIANDISLCYELLSKGAVPISMNVNYSCRNGYAEITELLVSNYKEPKANDIALWKQTAILNGHNNIAYLIDRLLNGLYIQFSKGNTDYFIRVITTAIKYTPGNGYMSKSSDCRPTKIILEEILDQFSRLGYMSYTLEYLNVLQKAVRDYLSINKLFHLGAEDIITTAFNYYRSYKDGIKTTDKRTLDGALLVVI